jgi:hypothetical protein
MVKTGFWVEGWSNGATDCEPAEPGKYWVTVRDQDDDEICIIVHRGDPTNPLGKRKVADAYLIADALNEKNQS